MKKTIRDFNLENKNVIIRVDFNVPISDGIITDDNRIKESLETIKYALSNNAKVILLSHLGRIKTEEDKEKNSLEKVSLRLEELLEKKVTFIKELDFNIIKEKIDSLNYGEVCLLENNRFYDLDEKKESSNDSTLASNYASLGEVFINDAFGTIHRAHASNVGIASILPSGIGFLVERELDKLKELDNPEREYTVILGGAKVSDKVKVISELAKKCDHLVIGGAMANTFLKAKGVDILDSLYEEECIDFCTEILNEYNDKLLLPIDYVIDDNKILDLGNETINLVKETLKNTKTVFWNGPLGYYEKEEYRNSTREIMTYLINSNIKTILGGGDIVACSSELGLKDKVYYASTGGGATLEYLEGKELPGLASIQDKE